MTLCGSTYAKLVCSTIRKQPSIIWYFCLLNRQAHSILDLSSSLILIFFFMIFIITYHTFLFNDLHKKNQLFSWFIIKSHKWCDDFSFWGAIRGSNPCITEPQSAVLTTSPITPCNQVTRYILSIKRRLCNPIFKISLFISF